MADVFMKSPRSDYWPTAIRMPNVTATTMGVVFKNNAPLRRSLYSYPLSQVKASLLAVASQIKRPAINSIDADPQAIIHSQWSRGYYHWITESLPRALIATDQVPNSVLMIPKSYGSFHPESLKLLDLRYRHFPGHNIRISDAVVTSCPNRYASTHPHLLRELRHRFLDAVSEGQSFGERIYISRANSRGRMVLNEAEVCSRLEEKGFICISPEIFTFREQVSIFKRARILVGIHGAGLTNLLFMRSGAAVVELLPYRNGFFDFRPNSYSWKHDHCYRTLAESMGHTHHFLECVHNKGFYERTNLADLTVDCGKLERVLNAVSE